MSLGVPASGISGPRIGSGMTATADRIQTLWQWCCDAYLRHGRKLAFPRGTDPTKTYQWRYLEALQRKFVEWDFDETLCRRFVEVTAAYAKKRGLIRKGLAIFFQRNLMQICYDMLRAEVVRHASTLDLLSSTHDWLLAQAGERPPVEELLRRGGLGSYTNLTKWYQAGHIADLYLALSRACGIALARLERLDPQERSLLPKATKLFLVRASYLKDSTQKCAAKSVLGDDWRSCL